jgi:hypothetical protein
MTTIELKDAKDAKIGDTLYRHRVSLEQKMSYTESGEVEIVTRKECLGDDEWEEVWETVDNRECLDRDEWSVSTSDHQEEVLKSTPFTNRCPHTVDMFAGTSDAGRLK